MRFTILLLRPIAYSGKEGRDWGKTAMKALSARLALAFACVGYTCMHHFTAFYFIIALSLEADRGIPMHELVKRWAAFVAFLLPKFRTARPVTAAAE